MAHAEECQHNKCYSPLQHLIECFMLVGSDKVLDRLLTRAQTAVDYAWGW